jgi:hypothetical protein
MLRRRNLILALCGILFAVGVLMVMQGKHAGVVKHEVPAGAAVPLDATAKEVVVGAFVNQIHEFSLRDNSFTVDFYLWFRWKDAELKPYETFSVVDGRIESRTDPVVRELPNGERHAYTRVVARVTRFFDVSDYPLDNHQLAIIVEEEDLEAQKLRYVADVENSAASPSILLPGWDFERLNSSAGVGTYHSNFGDPTLPKGNESSYARLTTAVSFTRVGANFFIKLFFGLWACVLLSMLAFFMRPVNVDPRFGVGVGALFGAIASQYVVANALPDTNVITLADQMHLVAFFFIITSVTQSTVSLWLWETDRQVASHRLDVWFRLGMPMAYVFATAWLLRN